MVVSGITETNGMFKIYLKSADKTLEMHYPRNPQDAVEIWDKLRSAPPP